MSMHVDPPGVKDAPRFCVLVKPVDYGRSRGLRPYEVRPIIVGRKPWHCHGTPMVRVEGGRP